MDTLSLVVIGLLSVTALFFFFASYKNSQTWTITHVLLTLGVFLFCIGFLILAAATLKTHEKWRVEYNQKKSTLATTLAQNEHTLNGSPADINAEDDEVIRNNREKLRRLLVGRGRVWRGCTPGQAAGNAITVNTIPPGTAPDAIRPHGLAENMLVYAFTEDQPGSGRPGRYVGEFQVRAAAGPAVTLAQTIPTAQPAPRAATWVLFEIMPTDGHDMGEGLAEEQLEQLFTAAGMTNPAMAVQEFLRDGQSATNNDPPENVMLKVRFLKEHEIPVDVAEGQATSGDRDYDATGLAVAGDLIQGEPTKFATGDVGLFDQDTAQDLIRRDICEPDPDQPRVFVRRLRNYAFEFHENFRRLSKLAETKTTLEGDLQRIVQSLNQARALVQSGQDEKTKLQRDKQGFERDRDAVVDYRGKLEAKHRQLQKELSVLYQTNNKLATEIASLQQRAVDRINRLTEQATAAAIP